MIPFTDLSGPAPSSFRATRKMRRSGVILASVAAFLVLRGAESRLFGVHSTQQQERMQRAQNEDKDYQEDWIADYKHEAGTGDQDEQDDYQDREADGDVLVQQVDEDIENGYEDMQNEENDQQEEEEWEEDYEEARQDLANFGQGEEEQKENDDEEAGGLLEALADPYADEGIQDEDLSTTGGDSTVSHPEVKLNLEDPEADQPTQKSFEEQADGQEENEVTDWVMLLATALRSGDDVGMRDAIYMAIESGEREALQEVVEEARDMVNGQKLRTLWEHLDQGPGQPRPMEEDVYPEEDTVQKLSAEAEGMEREAEGMMVEAQDMENGADRLEKQAGAIDMNSNEYSRIEATDELGETAEALDGEATKLEMESAKLKAEAVKLEQQAAAVRQNHALTAHVAQDVMALETEALRMNEEAAKLKQLAEGLHGKADQLDSEADRIERLEAQRLAADEEARQARIEQDLELEDADGDEEEEEFMEQRPAIKQPLSHAALVNRFKTLLHTS